MRTYYYIAKMKLLVSLTYRFDVFTSFGTSIILGASNIFLWHTAYKGIDNVAGVNESQMIAYVMVSVLLASFFSTTVEQTVQERITQGDIVVDFYRPINLILSYFAEDVGIAVSSLLSRLLPLLIFLLVFFQIPLPTSIEAFMLFLLSTSFSFLILWQISAVISLLCFWFLQLGNISTIKDGIILLLSGRFIPLWLFPKSMQNVLSFLPFQYIYQTPLSIYIGQMQPDEYLKVLTLQFAWVLLLALLLVFTWNRARKKVFIQGG